MVQNVFLFVFVQILCIFASECTSEPAPEQLHDGVLGNTEICPYWTKERARSCVKQQNLYVKPVSGFGNKLNGVLQGYLIAHILNRCLVIDWSYDELLSTSLHSTRKMLEMKRKGKTVRFPRGWKGVKKMIAMRGRKPKILKLQVGFRDHFCTTIRSNDAELGLPKQLLKNMRKERTLCVFLEGCILQNFLRPNQELSRAIREVEKSWLKNESVSIAIQVRMGDYTSISPEEQHILNTTYDERIPYHILDLFWDTAKEQAEKEVQKRGMKYASFFIATDSALVREYARWAFREQNLHFTSGKFRHSDLDGLDRETNLKMLADWYLISLADLVIQGPWSTYVEKALLNSSKKQQIFRCHNLNGETKYMNISMVSYKDDWGCFINILQDTSKGPRAVDH